MLNSKENLKNEILKHSTAHILATAVLEMFPEAKFGIGPAIEDGFYYDFDLPRTLIPEDLEILEEKMRDIIKKDESFERKEISIDEALEHFKKLKQDYKVEIIKDLKNKDETIVSIYKTGEFVDLCRGPHIESTRKINPQGFKLTKISGAYWKGDEKNQQMQRIYGVVFNNKKELKKYLHQQEEVKKRDHRKLGEELNLFMISEEVGKGLPLWLPNGAFVRKKLEDYMYKIEKKNGYDFVYTPILANEKLYQQSGHLAHYKDDMYNPIDIEGENYYLKPMNCPHHHIIYKHGLKSYRDLPIRLSDFSPIHRFERSGVLTGLIRARCFSQNDAHIYCRQDQLESEIKNTLEMFKQVYSDFNIKEYWFRLSLPDFENKEKYGDIKNKEMWEKSAGIARKVLDNSKEKYTEESGEAAFYGPKIDVQIKNVNGKEDTIATMQIDFYMPERFNLEFTNEKGEKERPVIFHRAIMGSFDRFFAFLVEQTGGNFPLWLSPIQVSIIPVSEKFDDYAKKIKKELLVKEIRAKINNKDESLGKRIHEEEKQRIPYILIVGEKEADNNTVAIRARNKKNKQEVATLNSFITKISEEIKEKE
ncbi:MAG TPA: threonine--tRNA ligase [Candidatus Moranbacteria bacterium]|nr:threonine--tRNA ligase [Candidatus Moranbacteria bacterium]